MQAQRKHVITMAIVSLVIFLIVNGLMILKPMKLAEPVYSSEFWQVTFTALILYVVAIILAAFHLKVSYYLLAVIIAVYTIGLVGVVITLFTTSHANLLLKLVVAIIALIGIVVNVDWYLLAFKLRGMYIQEMINQRTHH
ncbi:hypothetical protein [Lentilactobacillus laojiaonis]|uniref:hypothetical protein n=1 Tax=Lentilactobacillus laojiaonis TaxID=2883998 RepID=UPI001D0B376E|nr:hypothetical protein [Lentilactobacillus laojiaonis]UDM32224.1 hypothetical protein LHL71_00355 [Lentilactobacillus laojiaonis]